MRTKRVSYSIYQPVSLFAVAAGAVAIYQATCRQRCTVRPTDSPDSQLIAQETRRDVDRFLALLGTRERDILKRHCGMLGPRESYAEIGKRYGVTPQRIYEIIKIALRKVRASIPNNTRNT